MFHTTVGGVVTSATKELNDALHFTQNMHGNIMTPDTAFKTLQTCKTMAVRIYIYIYTYVYIYICTYIYMSWQTCKTMAVRIYIYIYTYVCVYIYVCHSRHARLWRSVYMNRSVCRPVQLSAHTYLHHFHL